MGEMKPKLAELFAYMDSTRSALLETVRGMKSPFAGVRPRDGSWSAAEILAHLAIVEGRVVNTIRTSIDAARAEGIGPDTSEDSMVATLDRFRVAEPVVKVSAPASIIPEGDRPIEESLAELERSRGSLRDLLESNADIDLHAVKRPHPMLRELDMYQWALFVAQHEERHRKQIESTLAEVTELAAESAPIV